MPSFVQTPDARKRFNQLLTTTNAVVINNGDAFVGKLLLSSTNASLANAATVTLYNGSGAIQAQTFVQPGQLPTSPAVDLSQEPWVFVGGLSIVCDTNNAVWADIAIGGRSPILPAG